MVIFYLFIFCQGAHGILVPQPGAESSLLTLKVLDRQESPGNIF